MEKWILWISLILIMILTALPDGVIVTVQRTLSILLSPLIACNLITCCHFFILDRIRDSKEKEKKKWWNYKRLIFATWLLAFVLGALTLFFDRAPEYVQQGADAELAKMAQ